MNPKDHRPSQHQRPDRAQRAAESSSQREPAMPCVYAPKPGPVMTYPGWDCRLPSVPHLGLNEGHPPAACTMCPWCLFLLQNCHPAAHSHAHSPCTSSATMLGQFYRPRLWLAHTQPESGVNIWISLYVV